MEQWEKHLWDKYYLDDEKRKLRIKSLKEEIGTLKTQIRFDEDDRLRKGKRSLSGIGGGLAPRTMTPRSYSLSSSGIDDSELVLARKKKKLKFLKDMNKERKKNHQRNA